MRSGLCVAARVCGSTTHSEHGSSAVSVERKTLARWMKSAPMACLDVSKNLDRVARDTLFYCVLAVETFGSSDEFRHFVYLGLVYARGSKVKMEGRDDVQGEKKKRKEHV